MRSLHPPTFTSCPPFVHTLNDALLVGPHQDMAVSEDGILAKRPWIGDNTIVHPCLQLRSHQVAQARAKLCLIIANQSTQGHYDTI
jgi:hypothetical protein